MLESFIELIKNATGKVIIPSFDKNYRYELLRFEKFYALYYHSKGSKWNLGGNHYTWIYDLNGNFDKAVSIVDGKPLERVRLLKADLTALSKYIKNV